MIDFASLKPTSATPLVVAVFAGGPLDGSRGDRLIRPSEVLGRIRENSRQDACYELQGFRSSKYPDGEGVDEYAPDEAVYLWAPCQPTKTQESIK